MRVTGIRRNASSSEWPHTLPPDQLINAVGDADYFVIAAPLTPATRGAITKDVLGQMKRSAWLINIARGAIVNERALIDALLRNQIAGAALDVFEYEPLPRESPLWSLDNVIITPHTAANSDRVCERSLSLLRENAERFRAGIQLRNVVRLDQGY
jgi:phosphoglycerate dehydrogenase-like enzyme